MTIAHAPNHPTHRDLAGPARPAPDLEAIKQRQQATWSTGDYHVIASPSANPQAVTIITVRVE